MVPQARSQTLAKVVIGVSSIGVALAGASIGEAKPAVELLAGLAGGVASNWLADLSLPWATSVTQSAFAGKGTPNHDIRKAIGRALAAALPEVERAWWAGTGQRLRGAARDDIAGLFRDLLIQGDKLVALLLDDKESKEIVAAGLAPLSAARLGIEDLQRTLEDFCRPYESPASEGESARLVAFLAQHLPEQLAYFFNEELKEDHRAQWAVETLYWEAARNQLAVVVAGQEVAGQAVTRQLALLNRLDRRLKKLARLRVPAPTSAEVDDDGLPDTFKALLQEATTSLAAQLVATQQRLAELQETALATRQDVATILALLRRSVAEEARGPSLAPSGGPPARLAVPPLPPNFVPRPDVVAQIRELLAQQSAESPAPVAIFGMGGIGKSALSIACCHDLAIQALFPDGIVWVNVGKDAGGVLEQLRTIGTVLGDIGAHYDAPQSASRQLATLLQDRAALIVVDDIWAVQQIQPFLLAAPRCRLLLTTRDRTIAIEIGALELHLDTLPDAEARQLLGKWAGRDVFEAEPIAARLGNLPLALKIAGVALREGMEPSTWLQSFRQIAQLKLGRRAASSQDNLEVCFELSCAQLAEPDRLLYTALGIFPTATEIPYGTIWCLWQALDPAIDRLGCDELLIELDRLALIDSNTKTSTIRLHDLLLSYVSGKLGSQTIATQRALLRAYNLQERPWSEVEDDGYLYNNLAHHLIAAGQEEDFHRLLLDSTGWMTARARQAGYGAYATDLQVAIRRFADPLPSDQIVLLARLYAALSLGQEKISTLTDEDLQILVWLDRPREALRDARTRPELEERFSGLLIVAETLAARGHGDSVLQEELTQTALAIEYDYQRGDALLRTFAYAISAPKGLPVQSQFAVIERQLRDLSTLPARIAALARLATLIREPLPDRAEALLDEIVGLVGAQAGELTTTGVIRYLVSQFLDLRQIERACILASYQTPALAQAELLALIARSFAGHAEDETFAPLVAQMRALLMETPEASRQDACEYLAVALAATGLARGGWRDLLAVAGLPADSKAREAIAVPLALSGGLTETLDMIATLTPERQVATCQQLLAHLPTPLDPQVAAIVAVAERAIGNLDPPDGQDNLRAELAIGLLARDQEIAAAAVAAPIETTESRERVVGAEVGAQVRRGQIEQAERLLDTIATSRHRPPALRAVALAWAERGERQRATLAFDRAVRESQVMVTSEDDLSTISALLVFWHRHGQERRAGACADLARELLSQHSDWNRGRYYYAMALARTEQPLEALATGREISDLGRRVALYRIAVALAEGGNIPEAEVLAPEFAGNWRELALFCASAVAHWRAGDGEGAAALLERVAETTQRLRDESPAHRLFEQEMLDSEIIPLIQALVRCQRPDLARQLGHGELRRHALAIDLVRSGDLAGGLGLFDNQQDERARLSLGYELALILWGEGRFAEALAQVKASCLLPPPERGADAPDRLPIGGLRTITRGHFLAHFAQKAAERGDTATASDLLGEAQRQLDGLQSGPERLQARHSLIETLCATGAVAQALALLGPQTFSDYLAALAACAPGFDRIAAGLGARCLDSALGIGSLHEPIWQTLHDVPMSSPSPAAVRLASAERSAASSILEVGPQLQAVLACEEGLAAMAENNSSVAEGHFSRGLAEAPTWAYLYEVRAYCRWDRRAFADALADFTTFLDLEATDVRKVGALEHRLHLYLARRDYASARGDLGALVQLAPEGIDVEWLGLFVNGLAGNINAAIDGATATIDANRGGDFWNYWRALLHLRRQDYESAARDLEVARTLLVPEPIHRAYQDFWEAVCRRQLGQPGHPSSSLDSWRESLRAIDDQQQQAWLEFMLLLGLDDLERARRVFDQYLRKLLDPWNVPKRRLQLDVLRHCMPTRAAATLGEEFERSCDRIFRAEAGGDIDSGDREVPRE